MRGCPYGLGAGIGFGDRGWRGGFPERWRQLTLSALCVPHRPSCEGSNRSPAQGSASRGTRGASRSVLDAARREATLGVVTAVRFDRLEIQ